ncbi:hypothetical protein RHAL1_01964 [Beijerinckiaceae bacterium RH AL1]|jgi:hypothetical protein|nr:hypothetical protein [Beijerinckiaceae bacterium]VVB45808.1 hypothetical protein RHCH11_RHCH11_01925 [Beijerinckiaceae bacterium RH CH11]VVB45884.1 hypothetical protein RHAL8_01921 [Beijerinckiaceae bacterium RH AL8]VVC55051.1 hypothetical protein RHAL1_01964 [Beijerinckiaceae bacterium RH AL1]
MLIDEIIRSCRSEIVAEAAVASIGPAFAHDVAAAAEARGLGVGEFTARSVQRFARRGGEGDMRSVIAVMDTSQEPILAGLHRIMSIMIGAGDSEEITYVRRGWVPPEAYRGSELRRERLA